MADGLLEHATHTIAVGSKSFASASRLFDPVTRRSALMLYTWCRHCDDVIDGQQYGFATAKSDNVTQLQRLGQLRAETQRAYAGEPMRSPPFAAFQDVALANDITPALAFDHLQGYAMDVEQQRFFILEDTLRYCYHVAGVVGLMMAKVMGVRDSAVLDRACDLGLAFQLTNIARDIIEDANAGRCYLPEQWLSEAGLTRDNLTDPARRADVARLASRLVDEAEPYYRSALNGLPGLPLRSAWAVATAHGVYREIGLKVQNAGIHAWDRRQKTGRLGKLRQAISGAVLALGSRRFRPSARPQALWQRPH